MIKQKSQELSVLLIDLHALSKGSYFALEAKRSEAVFTALPGRTIDSKHHNPYGAYVLAHLIAERSVRPGLTRLASSPISRNG